MQHCLVVYKKHSTHLKTPTPGPSEASKAEIKKARKKDGHAVCKEKGSNLTHSPLASHHWAVNRAKGTVANPTRERSKSHPLDLDPSTANARRPPPRLSRTRLASPPAFPVFLCSIPPIPSTPNAGDQSPKGKSRPPRSTPAAEKSGKA